MNRPTVSFVVPSRNSARTISACVMSLRHQAYDNVEIVVVDNDSTDDTAARALAAGADRVIIAGPERCAQRNRGALESTGEFVVFIDDPRYTTHTRKLTASDQQSTGVQRALIPVDKDRGDGGDGLGCRRVALAGVAEDRRVDRALGALIVGRR